MNVLFATPYLPCPPDFGGARRMYELIRGVRRLSDLQILSMTDQGSDLGATEAELGSVVPVPVPFTARSVSMRKRRMLQLRSLASCESAQHHLYINAAYQLALDRLIATGEIDLVQFEFSQMGGYRVQGGVPTVLDIHNVEHDLMRRMASSGSSGRRLFNAIEYRKFRREELDAWRNATCCVATSGLDAEVVSRHVGREVPLIPSGVDLDYFTPLSMDQSRPGTIAFIGAMRYRPNAEGARFFAEKVFSLVRSSNPDSSFTVVGADPTPEVQALSSIPGVTVTGTVPDVRPWLESAEVVAVPLLSGGGTRIKILEAFAAGRPVVSTSIGAEGIDVVDREHLLKADDPSVFAQAVVELMRDRALRERLTADALTLVRERYQWSAIAERLGNLHAELVHASHPAR